MIKTTHPTVRVVWLVLFALALAIWALAAAVIWWWLS